jgi:hypothetical protein
MRVTPIAVALLILVSGCADLAYEPTPVEWKIPTKALFRVSDTHGVPVGTFTLELTAEPAETCIAGSWLRAKPIASDLKILDLASWWSHESLAPSYQISGRLLSVQLNGGNICDDYVEVTAKLAPQGAKGVLQSGGMFGGDRYGHVVVERLQ